MEKPRKSSFISRQFKYTLLAIGLCVIATIFIIFLYRILAPTRNGLFGLVFGLSLVALPAIISLLFRHLIRPLNLFLKLCGVVIIVWFMLYSIFIRFAITTVQAPSFCRGEYTQSGTYAIDGKQAYILRQDSDSVIATVVNNDKSTDTYLVRKDGRAILQKVHFANDTVAVALYDHIAYIFNDGLGTWVDTVTGQIVNSNQKILSIDSYGLNNNGNFEVSAIITIWYRDGTMQNLAKIPFSGITQGCSVSDDGTFQAL